MTMRTDLSRLPALGAPAQMSNALAGFLRATHALLPTVGVYLYGSLARGAYRPPASDVDILIVTSSSTPEAVISEVRAALAAARAHGARVDAIVATRDQVAGSALPAALDVVFPPDAEPQRCAGNRGMMFPLDRQDVWECGVSLFGVPAREVIPPAPTEMLHASLAWTFPHLARHFKNPELMLCRAAHVFLEGRLCSKPEAGRWALVVFDPRWHGTIEAALASREEGQTQQVCSPEELDRFQRTCADLIEGATGVRVHTHP